MKAQPCGSPMRKYYHSMNVDSHQSRDRVCVCTHIKVCRSHLYNDKLNTPHGSITKLYLWAFVVTAWHRLQSRGEAEVLPVGVPTLFCMVVVTSLLDLESCSSWEMLRSSDSPDSSLMKLEGNMPVFPLRTPSHHPSSTCADGNQTEKQGSG